MKCVKSSWVSLYSQAALEMFRESRSSGLCTWVHVLGPLKLLSDDATQLPERRECAVCVRGRFCLTRDRHRCGTQDNVALRG